MPPSPKIEEAYHHVSREELHPPPVTAEYVVRAGKHPVTASRASPLWGLRFDAYIRQVEVFDRIHCLNELRKELHLDYYFEPRKKRTGLQTSHVSHCLHIPLQQLMCPADVDIIKHYWLRDEEYSDLEPRPFPDFSLEKARRDFDSVLQWLQAEGGIRDLWAKFPMQPPAGGPLTVERGYSNAES